MTAARFDIFGYLGFLSIACLIVFAGLASYSSEVRATSNPSATAAQYPPGPEESDAEYSNETMADGPVSNGQGEDEVVDAAVGDASEALQVIGNNDEEQDAAVASSTRRYDAQTPQQSIRDRETPVSDSGIPRSTVITELPDTGGLNPSLMLLATVLLVGTMVAVRNFIPEE